MNISFANKLSILKIDEFANTSALDYSNNDKSFLLSTPEI